MPTDIVSFMSSEILDDHQAAACRADHQSAAIRPQRVPPERFFSTVVAAEPPANLDALRALHAIQLITGLRILNRTKLNILRLIG